MADYSLVFVTPKSEAWIPDYLAAVTPLIQKHGGKYLARTSSHERLEGATTSPALIVILEWPSREAFQGFYRDPAYQPFLQARLAGAENDFFMVEGKDDFASS